MRPRSLTFSLLIVLALAAGCSGGGKETPTSPPGGGGNQNPTVNLNIDKTVVSAGETAALTATTADPDGDQVTLSWAAGRGTVSSSGPTATTATYTAPNTGGLDSAVVTVLDGKGGTGRAAAETYVRNPNVPVFTLGAINAGPPGCYAGSFILTITSPEDLLIDSIAIQPLTCVNICRTIVNYTPVLFLAADQTHTWDRGGCQNIMCCQNSTSCGNCGNWSITIWGHRPAPDGGAFVYECREWSGPGDANCSF